MVSFTNSGTSTPESPKTPPKESPYIAPRQSDFLYTFTYALPRFSDLLRRLTDMKGGASMPLTMSPAVGLWLTLALIGIVISANSYFVGMQQTWGLTALPTTVIPLGREDAVFAPLALFPPVLVWLSHVVNFCSVAVGTLIPDIPWMQASPLWQPTPRATVWSDATLALTWWGGLMVSVVVSSAQGLFTRVVGLSKQREYATRLNKINRIDLNPKAISPAKREVRKANHYGQAAVWLMALFATAAWGWELFLADGALTGSSFETQARWLYGLCSTFLAELGWLVSQSIGKEIK